MNAGPLAPEARITQLDHCPMVVGSTYSYIFHDLRLFVFLSVFLRFSEFNFFSKLLSVCCLFY